MYKGTGRRTEGTAIEWLVDSIDYNGQMLGIREIIEQARKMEREQMLGFHQWMLENDTTENGERFFHYSDSDMLTEYLRESRLQLAD